MPCAIIPLLTVVFLHFLFAGSGDTDAECDVWLLAWNREKTVVKDRDKGRLLYYSLMNLCVQHSYLQHNWGIFKGAISVVREQLSARRLNPQSCLHINEVLKNYISSCNKEIFVWDQDLDTCLLAVVEGKLPSLFGSSWVHLVTDCLQAIDLIYS